jgi:hypothetical protein
MATTLTDFERDLVVELVNNFVIDGGPEEDPIYQDALALVSKLQPRVTVELDRAELDTIISALHQAERGERGNPTLAKWIGNLEARLALCTPPGRGTPSIDHVLEAVDQDARYEAASSFDCECGAGPFSTPEAVQSHRLQWHKKGAQTSRSPRRCR